jgi:hypothetical protein
MSFDLLAVLPALLPRAIAWAEARSQEILSTGQPLTERGKRIARHSGVVSPDRIRVKIVPSIPRPDDTELLYAATSTGLLSPSSAGLTLGYGIYIAHAYQSDSLLAHECRHVFQYESAGSIANFLPSYLMQIAEFGYEMAPYEIDARQFESIVV